MTAMRCPKMTGARHRSQFSATNRICGRDRPKIRLKSGHPCPYCPPRPCAVEVPLCDARGRLPGVR